MALLPRTITPILFPASYNTHGSVELVRNVVRGSLLLTNSRRYYSRYQSAGRRKV